MIIISSGCIGGDEPFIDTDGDGLDDAIDEDDDGDGYSDEVEFICLSSRLKPDSVPSDYDEDGLCDPLDDDDDGDGVLDTMDVFPFDANESSDLDGDGIGDVSDLDDDGDGWTDNQEEACGHDSRNKDSTPRDKDGDGVCNSLDPHLMDLLNLIRFDKKLSRFSGDDYEQYAYNMTTWQLEHGGWEKWNEDEYQAPWDGESSRSFYETNGTELGSLADRATTREIRFLSSVYKNSTNEDNRTLFKESVQDGINFIIEAQHESGGWPQVYPAWVCNGCEYTSLMTYNDHVIATSLLLLKDIRDGLEPFDSQIVEGLDMNAISNSVDKALQFILNSQVEVEGKLTIWGQQHDPVSYESLGGRAYELPCRAASESSFIAIILINWDDRSAEVVNASWGAIEWYESSMISGMRYDMNSGTFVEQGGAMMWYRFYNVSEEEYFMAGRDGIKVYQIEDLTMERRTGYMWGGDWGAALIEESLKIPNDERNW